MKTLFLLIMTLFINDNSATRETLETLIGKIEVYQDDNGNFYTEISTKNIHPCYIKYIVDLSFPECDSIEKVFKMDSLFQSLQLVPLNSIQKEGIKRI